MTPTTAEIVALYQEHGMSILEVSTALKIGTWVTHRILVEYGVTLRQPGRQPGASGQWVRPKPCKGMTWAGLNDKADIPAEMFEIRETYRR